MPKPSLEEFKRHVRADDFSGDDALLGHYLATATAAVVDSTRRTEEELCGLNGGDFPLQLTQAAYMLAAHWYNQRESVSPGQMSEVPDTLQSLLKPWRRFRLKKEGRGAPEGS